MKILGIALMALVSSTSPRSLRSDLGKWEFLDPAPAASVTSPPFRM